MPSHLIARRASKPAIVLREILQKCVFYYWIVKSEVSLHCIQSGYNLRRVFSSYSSVYYLISVKASKSPHYEAHIRWREYFTFQSNHFNVFTCIAHLAGASQTAVNIANLTRRVRSVPEASIISIRDPENTIIKMTKKLND